MAGSFFTLPSFHCFLTSVKLTGYSICIFLLTCAYIFDVLFCVFYFLVFGNLKMYVICHRHFCIHFIPQISLWRNTRSNLCLQGKININHVHATGSDSSQQSPLDFRRGSASCSETQPVLLSKVILELKKVHCTTVHGSQKLDTTQRPSAAEWIRVDLWCIHTSDHSSVLKMNRLQLERTCDMNLSYIKLNKRSEKKSSMCLCKQKTQASKTHLYYLVMHSWITKP